MAEVKSGESPSPGDESVPVSSTQEGTEVGVSKGVEEEEEGAMQVEEDGTVPEEKSQEAKSNTDSGYPMDSSAMEDATATADSSLGPGTNETHNSAEGVYMQHLLDVLSKTVKKCVHAGRFSTFARNYKFAYQNNPKALQSIAQQHVQHLQDNVQAEIQLLLSEEEIPVLFNKLETILNDAATEENTTTWRPSGDPEKDLRSHRMAVKLKEREELQKRLAAQEQETARLQKSVLQSRQKLLHTQQKLQDKMEMFAEAAAACDTCPMERVCELQLMCPK
ncbi:PREDICTED: polyamine-modulated factor 1-like [Branchiostoma belcheri]|uniref:Polyamine-modulated factor 1-like n=1 Tax=Branchiostoma belcheri TaxID=7741 RepID=A0A6P4XUZ7_BRABE|nr:PREDICTED: polyamine-modulated factor 1-like [Branchiostoma belcheri]